MNTKSINIQALAFIGDAVLSLYIREELLKKGIVKANILQKKTTEYVSAKGEVKILNHLITSGILTEEEIEIIRRGRNNKKDSHPKNTDIITYKWSTGFEALLGYLYLNNIVRLKEILKEIGVE